MRGAKIGYNKQSRRIYMNLAHLHSPKLRNKLAKNSTKTPKTALELTQKDV